MWVWGVSLLSQLCRPLMRNLTPSLLAWVFIISLMSVCINTVRIWSWIWGPVGSGSNMPVYQSWSPGETSLIRNGLQEHSFFQYITPIVQVAITTLPPVALVILSLSHWTLWGNRNGLPHQSNVHFAVIGRWVSCSLSSLEKWWKRWMLPEICRQHSKCRKSK